MQRSIFVFLLLTTAVACSEQKPENTGSETQGIGGAAINTSDGGDCMGSGGCIFWSEPCGDAAEVASCVEPEGRCGAEVASEGWEITASSCTDLPNGYYYFGSRQAGQTPAGCPGWSGCVVGSYKSQQGDEASVWRKGGGEACGGYPPACNGLPFGIVDDLHPVIDGGCSYQCIASEPGDTAGTATCEGPNEEACSLTYEWENLLP